MIYISKIPNKVTTDQNLIRCHLTMMERMLKRMFLYTDI